MCDLADFSEVLHRTSPTKQVSPQHQGNILDQVNGEKNFVQPSLHIDIQIHISPDATLEQIDQIFASMGKYIYRLKTSSDE